MIALDAQVMKKKTVLVVDDEPTNLQVLKSILEPEYRLLFAKDGPRAIELASTQHPDLILLDVMMGGMSGFDVCKVLKADPVLAPIPVIFSTALSDTGSEEQGFAVGGVDYITKPVNAIVVRARVKTHLELVRGQDLKATSHKTVEILGRAAEYKDNETGLHVVRMSHFSQILALALGWSEDEAENLLMAAPMHDVGKIGIPDAILRKPGKLTEAEWEVMRTHPQIGADIIGDHSSHMLKMARMVAMSHHEKWDGSGYPDGLRGEEIPQAARIVAIADVFDALTSVRPYKAAWSVDEAIALLREQAGQHFDPQIVEIFVHNLEPIKAIRQRWQEREA